MGLTARPKPRDLAALLAVAVAAVALLRPVPPWAGGAVIHVDPGGSDWRSGRSESAAVRTVQRAADLAAPGDTVLIGAGVYRERVRVRRGGRPRAPVVFRAAEPGGATLSGEVDPEISSSLAWRDEGGGVYSAEVPWPVHQLRVDGRYAYHLRWGRLNGLRALVERDDAWDASLYLSEERRLYLAPRGGSSPGGLDIAFHGPIPSPREWGNIRSANVRVEAGHVVFEGIRFVGGVGAGVHVWNGIEVTVRDCLFEGAAFGVATRPRVATAESLTVEYSVYHNYPQAAWREAWLSWDEVYAHYASHSLVHSSTPGVRIRHNVIAHGGDPLQVTSGGEGDPWAVEITDNLIFRATDDALEFDGPGIDMLVAHNLVYDTHVTLGLSPVSTGPTVVERNLVLQPYGGLHGAHLKLLNPQFDPEDASPSVIRNVDIRRNTLVGNWLAWYNEPPVEDVRVTDNLFAVQRTRDPRYHGGVEESGNVYVALSTAGYDDPGTDPRWWDGEATAYGASGITDAAGRSVGPVGAADPGAPWRMERPGPRWLDFGSLPATADIPRRLAPELLTRSASSAASEGAP